MYLQGHTTPNHPSHPVDPVAPHPHKSHHPTHRRAPGHAKPAPAKPAHQHRITHPRPVGRRTAGRYEPTLDGSALVLIGLKIGAH